VLRAGLLAVAVIASLTTGLASPAVAVDGVTEVCSFTDDRFTEISGMTYSQRHDDVIYLHNDSSGGPLVYAVDSRTCQTLATLTIDGIEARDMEAIASGRDAKGRPVLWVGDIGDNRDSWPEVRLHRVREPKVLRDRTLRARTYRFTYPERPLNAEALLADPGSTRVWVVTKQTARGTLYALPERMSRSEVNVATTVGAVGALVTDGSVSPDGTRFALRDYVDAEVFAGLPPGTDPRTVYLPLQLQGEAMTWTQDGAALLVASERDERLLRVDLPGEQAAEQTPIAAAPTPVPNGEQRPSSEDADGPQPTARQGDDPGLGPWLIAGVLLAAAAGVIATAEWVRRRAPGERRG
jgi:hypothetical protein